MRLTEGRALLSLLVSMLATRLDLARRDLEIYATLTGRALSWAAVALVFGLLVLMFLGIAVIATLWDSHRRVAVWGVAIAYLGIGGLSLARAFILWRARPRMLELTLSELAKDRDALKSPGAGESDQ